MTLHEQAIEWLTQQFSNAINNHYAGKKVLIEGLVPDIIVNGNIHEVEVVSDKSSYKKIKNFKTMWIVVPNFKVFDKINLIGEVSGQFVRFKVMLEAQIPQNLRDLHILPKIVDKTIEVNRLTAEITQLKTARNRLIRDIRILEAKHKIKKRASHRVLYMLPSFEFEKHLTPDKCAICDNESDVIIENKDVPKYGLCKDHFDALIKLEE